MVGGGCYRSYMKSLMFLVRFGGLVKWREDLLSFGLECLKEKIVVVNLIKPNQEV